MKVLILQRYGALGASSRLRTLQYLPHLRADGIDVELNALFSDEYLKRLYQGRRSIKATVRGYLSRIRILMRVSSYDVVITEKEALPWVPAWLEMWFLRKATLWLDYDDAVFHRYDKHRSRIVRWLLGRKLDRLMRRADLVTCGNAYLASRAEVAGCKRVERVPTVVDLSRYDGAPQESGTPITIGWIGSPSTAKYLRDVSPAIAKLSEKHQLRCIAIGARQDQLADTPFEVLPWTEETEAASIRQMDIGIMPLPDTPWERGKCGYKLIQYMACYLPVVASPVGINGEIVREGENGFLASTSDEWYCALERLVLDSDSRRRMGSQGRMRVESEFCLNVQAPRVLSFLYSLQGK